MDASPLIVGGRTALELQGYAHYLAHSISSVYLYGPKAPPAWVGKLPLDMQFIYRSDRRLFDNEPIAKGLDGHKWNVETGEAKNITAFQVTTRQLLLGASGTGR